ncbi:GNAT family N-acetyltransferase [Gaetbulibacter sp. M235]|uniref:GNAT family N-acetyltransferase n=1 Tax=Gaetbulibacter sp. M235 TaxID=3126510 RepID=UPI00374E948D
MTEFLQAITKQHFEEISALANIIWQEHYTSIIGFEQVDYMVKNYQSAEVMYSQYNDGYSYFKVYHDNQFVGYISIKKQEDSLFLSKIYVSKDFRGQKIGKSAMEFVQAKAIEMNCKSITLCVNRFNVNSIKAYEAMGFKTVGEMITDIGNGFVMDDYKMEKVL